MSEISRKDFLGLGTMATAGLASGCAPGTAAGANQITGTTTAETPSAVATPNVTSSTIHIGLV